MARYELTLSNGEKMVAEHPSPSIDRLLIEVEANAFILVAEIKSGSTSLPKEVLVATRQITLIRTLDEGSMQGSGFKAKR